MCKGDSLCWIDTPMWISCDLLTWLYIYICWIGTFTCFLSFCFVTEYFGCYLLTQHDLVNIYIELIMNWFVLMQFILCVVFWNCIRCSKKIARKFYSKFLATVKKTVAKKCLEVLATAKKTVAKKYSKSFGKIRHRK